MNELRRSPLEIPLRALASVLALGLATALSHADNWPGWRGPTRNGLSEESQLPSTWSATENIAWKVPLPGNGIANPVIWGDRIFITESDGPRHGTLHLICLSRKTGEELWHRKYWGTSPTLFHASKSSMASPSPVTDGKHVFAFYGTGDVFCLTVDGDLVWQRSLADEYGPFENRFAASSSPILHEGLLLLQCDHYGASYVLGIDAATGANRWKADRPECWLSWASPQLVPLDNGKHELIVSGSHKVEGYDPITGEKHWTLGGLARECIPTPVFGHGLLYVVSGPKSPTFALKPGGRGDIEADQLAWSSNRGSPFVPSAILVGERYYLVDDAGIATCLDAHKGKTVWQKRLPGRYTASPVSGDGKIYLANEDGTTTVLYAGSRTYDEIGRNDLGEPIFASPAISQGSLFIRTPRHLWRIGGKAGE